MKKIYTVLITLALLLSFCLGVGASNGLEEIIAYFNHDITINFNDQVQEMYDANGERVYPISYNGTTYLPVRAVSNMLGFGVDWDAASNSVLLTTQPANSSATETLVFGTNAEYPPFEFITPNGIIGKYDGIDVAIAKHIAESNGMTAVIEDMEFDSLILALMYGNVDATIAGMTVTAERLEFVDFSIPYYSSTQVMLVREGSDIANAFDLSDKKIAVLEDYVGMFYMQDLGYEYTSVETFTDAAAGLANGTFDAVIIDSTIAQHYINITPGFKVVEDNDVFFTEEYAIAVKKGNRELLNKINAGIQKMIDNGTLSRITLEYFGL
ncbi:MAG: transporter substrate-binding domain-containing protein [Clostridia bacterium]|nr:transporter substrate-binding domain-containing protein [Clostridia bacterium]